MKKLAILTCLKATGVCSGAACMSAVNRRDRAFAEYAGEEVELCAFFHCNGCDCDYGNDKEYKEKIEYVSKLGLDALHIGKCTLQRGIRCDIISDIARYCENQNIQIVWETH